jgi:hypothetical protein
VIGKATAVITTGTWVLGSPKTSCHAESVANGNRPVKKTKTDENLRAHGVSIAWTFVTKVTETYTAPKRIGIENSSSAEEWKYKNGGVAIPISTRI